MKHTQAATGAIGVRGYGLGPLPGTRASDLPAAADMVLSETGDCPHIPDLPARGLGFDPVGKTSALLPGITVERGPRSWRLAARPQLVSRRAVDDRQRDLDILEECWAGQRLSSLKCQLLGPWSLAAGIELFNGHRALTDPGVVRDLTQGLSQAAADYARQLSTRFGLSPGEVRIQFDEPVLAAINSGTLEGTSDFDTIPAVAAEALGDRVEELTGAVRALMGEDEAPEILLNLTSGKPLFAVARGIDVVLVQWSEITKRENHIAFGEALDKEHSPRIGVGMALTPGDTALALATDIARWGERIGVEAEHLSTRLDITASGHLETLSLPEAGRVYQLLQETAGLITRDIGNI